ncbi:hypothetical protein EG68_00127 [Paragonimus skrjabini miyazakii]|uniref:Homeobox domain-containing protein n=1 Tax=Paragonimus skrjabini miyazakii TaxID=59628 RepID=A0A8S9ZA18_9TREM|nr:hypothetical protein EG68_00127 [Paragonimus skrjabini miyazakii]
MSFTTSLCATKRISPKFTVAFAAANLVQTHSSSLKSAVDSPDPASPSETPLRDSKQSHDTDLARDLNLLEAPIPRPDAATNKFKGSPATDVGWECDQPAESLVASHDPVRSHMITGGDKETPFRPSVGFSAAKCWGAEVSVNSHCAASHQLTVPSVATTYAQVTMAGTTNRLQDNFASVLGQSRPFHGSVWPTHLDTRSALATISAAYVSLLKNSHVVNASVREAPGLIYNQKPIHSFPTQGTKPVTDILPPLSNPPALPLLSTHHGFPAGLGVDKTPLFLKAAHSLDQDSLQNTMTNLLTQENLDCWQQFQQATYATNLDPQLLTFYGGSGGAFELSGNSRRKNATRETTSMLKAWLNEHRKNPYPTKGEKIMLAIVTKMSLTQVSTWFANARRRLKKENKMTWIARNSTSMQDADSNGDGEEDIDEEEDGEDEQDLDCLVDVDKVNGAHPSERGHMSDSFTRCPVPSYCLSSAGMLPNMIASKDSSNFQARNATRFSSTVHRQSVTEDEPPFKRAVKDGIQSNDPFRQQKIWSLVELAQEQINREARAKIEQEDRCNDCVPSNWRHFEKASTQNWMRLLANAHSNETTAKMSMGLTKNAHSLVTDTGPIAELGSKRKAQDGPSSIADFTPKMMKNSLNCSSPVVTETHTPNDQPFASPATLAAFYLYYQQQQQQYQLQLQQHSQRLLQPYVDPISPTTLSLLKASSRLSDQDVSVQDVAGDAITRRLVGSNNIAYTTVNSPTQRPQTTGRQTNSRVDL